MFRIIKIITEIIAPQPTLSSDSLEQLPNEAVNHIASNFTAIDAAHFAESCVRTKEIIYNYKNNKTQSTYEELIKNFAAHQNELQREKRNLQYTQKFTLSAKLLLVSLMLWSGHIGGMWAKQYYEDSYQADASFWLGAGAYVLGFEIGRIPVVAGILLCEKLFRNFETHRDERQKQLTVLLSQDKKPTTEATFRHNFS